jgi:hypothetical protein
MQGLPRVVARACHHVLADSIRVANASSWVRSTMCGTSYFREALPG